MGYAVAITVNIETVDILDADIAVEALREASIVGAILNAVDKALDGAHVKAAVYVDFDGEDYE